MSTTFMFVLFGRPGAGKSSVAKEVVQLFEQRHMRTMCQVEESSVVTTTPTRNMPIQQIGTDRHGCIRRPAKFKLVPVDLDVCIPQWMRDDFANGIYPTWKQRQEFAQDCCNHVQHVVCLLQETTEQLPQEKTIIVMMVSFSFVNTDLRERFRECFPHAHWILLDTPPHEAQQRIEERRGHFYKGSPLLTSNINNPIPQQERMSLDNSEWNFAPVTFPHTILDGNNPIQVNATIIMDWLKMKLQ
jgi:gluconate kinase